MKTPFLAKVNDISVFTLDGVRPIRYLTDMGETIPPPAGPPGPASQTPTPTADKRINLSIGQALTIGSVTLGTVATIAYAIASFMQTRYVVDKLEKSSEKVQKDIDTINEKLGNLSHQIDQRTVELSKEIADKTADLSKQIAAKR